jgi:hypothetical protein
LCFHTEGLYKLVIEDNWIEAVVNATDRYLVKIRSGEHRQAI